MTVRDDIAVTPLDEAAVDLREARFAIYYAPPSDSAWWYEGSRWLGRDAQSGAPCDAPAVPGLSQSLHGLTIDARRYGWHATLKPPMRLRDGAGVSDLRAAAMAVAARHRGFDVSVHAALLGAKEDGTRGFMALRPAHGQAAREAIDALAHDCVTSLDALRMPATPDELAQRRATGLTPRQDALLQRWGYPFVGEEFRFHMTLSDRVGDSDATAIRAWWAPRVAALGPLPVNDIAIFVQARAGEPFHLAQRIALRASMGDEA
ncbi:hypothetical protein PTE30175_03135 [Pandoraea terrae]|uniref:Phosphonate metabolism protein n=1 Tax=Pandoraea terrae TaxID=1537710 RepID=A0A5E4WHM5_9BURK|nr:DUF1045 domain-containing protein [Pandoraea terrae]VVE22535.1 hypothetical protein PTE30175_03135 [Pandoraea terrae]